MNGCAMDSRECAGRLEWHHAVKQQRIRSTYRFGAYRSGDRWRPRHRTDSEHYLNLVGYPGPYLTVDEILGDERNRVWLCSHHHELVTNGRLEVTLPQSVWDFTAEFGLTAMLENDLARRSAA